MSNNSRSFNREITEEFIHIYRNNSCLWDVKSKDYHDKIKRDAAYKKLIAKMKEVDPSANRETAVKKINILRTNYLKEKKKVIGSRNSDSKAEEYQPRLWYYTLFDFLENNDCSRSSMSSVTNEVIYFEDVEKQMIENPEDIDNSIDEFSSSTHIVRPDSPADTDNSCRSTSSIPKSLHYVRPPKRNLSVIDTINSGGNNFKKIKLKDDRYDICGKIVTAKLRDITDNVQRLLAEKIINDALFMAEMNQLTLYHSISTPTSLSAFQSPQNSDSGFISHIRTSTSTYKPET